MIRSKHSERDTVDPVRSLAPWPCSHPSGSQEKVEVLRWREENNHLLWHPDDSTSTIPPRADLPREIRVYVPRVFSLPDVE